MKRFISIIMSAAIIAAMLPSVFAAGKTSYIDMSGSEYCADAVRALSALEILEGYEDNSFGAGKSITRAEMAAVICRMTGKETDADSARGKTSFDDVSGEHWASGYINVAASGNIIEGDGDGRFRPEDNVKFEEALKMVVCAVGLGADIKSDSEDWSAEYITAAENAKITAKLTGGKGKASTRGDVAVMVYNGLRKDLTAPEASKEAGSYRGSQTVELTAAEGTEIYYTTDGSAPTTDGKKYSKAITVSSSCTLKAVSVKSGVLYSDEMSRKYTITSASSRSSRSSSGSGIAATAAPIATAAAGGTELPSVESAAPTAAAMPTETAAPKDTETPLTEPPTEEPQTPIDPDDDVSDIIKYTEPGDEHIAEGTLRYDEGTYEGMYVDNQLVVVTEEGTAEDKVAALAAENGAEIAGYLRTIGFYQLEFDEAKSLTELYALCDKLIALDYIYDAYPNTVYETEPQYSTNDYGTDEDWNEHYSSGNNWGLEAINVPSAWDLLIDKYGSLDAVPKVKVGIIEEYFDTEHEDLRDRFSSIWVRLNGFETVQRAFGAESPNSKVREKAKQAKDIEEYYQISHGTHVAGIIGAHQDNEKGLAGVAPNSCLIGYAMTDEPLKNRLENSVSLFESETILAVLIEKENVQVINYSQGTDQDTAKDSAGKIEKELKSYLNEGHDFLIVASAGNTFEEDNGDSLYASQFTAITAEDIKDRIVVVSAAKNSIINEDKSLEISSVYGGYNWIDGYKFGSRIDVLAPGVNVYSTVIPTENWNSGGYDSWDGTSMAAPHVSGLAALIWGADPSLKGDEVKRIICDTADISVSNTDSAGFYHPMVDASYAVATALGEPWAADDGIFTGDDTNDVHWEYLRYEMIGYKPDAPSAPLLCVSGPINSAPWWKYNKNIRFAQIYSDKIPKSLFADYERLTDVQLYCKEIGEEAFFGCPIITVELGDGSWSSAVERICSYAFYDCKFTEIRIPASVKEIGEYAFGYYNDDGTPRKISGFTIYGYRDSAAEKYANENGFKFVNLDIIITFDPNGGTVDVASKIVENGEQYGELPTPVRTGYIFTGWYGYSGLEIKLITEKSKVDLASDSVLTAHWEPIAQPEYTVTFDATGGTVSPGSISVKNGDAYGTLPTPVRSGYLFAGWYTTTAYNEQITSSTRAQLSADQTLYAKWEKISEAYTINIEPYSCDTAGRRVDMTATLYSTGGEYIGSVYGYNLLTCTIRSGQTPGYVLFDGYINGTKAGGIYRITSEDIEKAKGGNNITAAAYVYTGYSGSDFL